MVSQDSKFELPSEILESCRKYRNQIALIYDDGILPVYVSYNEVNSMIESLTEFIKPLKISNHVIGYFGGANSVFISLFISILAESAAIVVLNSNSATENEHLIEKVGIKWIFADEKSKNSGYRQIGCKFEDHQSITLPHGKLVLLNVISPRLNSGVKNYKLKLAYVIQTSGTTGKPKIVHVPHSCILPNIKHLSEIFSIRTSDILLLNSPLTFDPSVVEMCLSLINGSTLLIIPEIIKINPQKFLNTITRHKITILMATPSTIKRMGTEQVVERLFHSSSSLRIMCFGGEVCPSVATLKKWIGNGNKTSFFNIYGVTEASCWATIHQITTNDLENEHNNEIPLGKALSLTEIEVRDDGGRRIDNGEGFLFVGGRERVCFIDDEDDGILRLMPVFRETGDFVRIDVNGEMYFVHRRDNQVKRYGKKVSMALIEDVSSNFSSVETSTAVFDIETQEIHLFLTLKNQTSIPQQLRAELDHHLHLALPPHAIPNTIQQISSLPLTNHGKINSDKLIKLARSRERKPESLQNYIQQEWKRLLNVLEIEANDKFVMCGGDSIQIIHFAEDLSALTGLPLPRLVDLLLNDTFANVCAYIDEQIERKETIETTNHFEMNNSTDVSDKTCEMDETNEKLVFSQRGGQVVTDLSLSTQVVLKWRWKFDLNKCVDASALLVGSTEKSKGRVFIGSHSNEFAAIDLMTGKAIWVTMLGGRIESSACVSLCGTLVVVGCYDNFIYCLFEHNGETKWKFLTNSQIKCSPTIDPHSGNVLIGSHDHYLYCIDVNSGSCIWKVAPTQASIFASPTLAKQPYCLYVGTLDGVLCSINPSNGSVKWERNVGKPIFASPVVADDKIFAANVNGELYCFSHAGKQVWSFSTFGSIFSSPNVVGKRYVMFGCHNHKFYCVLVETGDVHWVLEMNSPVYATPFSVYDFSASRSSVSEDGSGRVGVIACITGEIKVVSLKDGDEIASYTLSGEIFSSPVVLNDKLVIGCRDNYVHCFDFFNCVKLD